MQTTVQLTFATAAAAAAFLAALPAEGAAATTAGVVAGNVKAAETTPEVRYFINTASDTIFELKKGDKAPTGSAGSTQITAAEYEAHKTRLAAKYKALQTGTAASPASASTNTAAGAAEFDPFAEDGADAAAAPVEVDEPTLLAKLQELSKFTPDGRTLLMSWLERANVKGVPAFLKGKTAAERGTIFADAKKHMGQ